MKLVKCNRCGEMYSDSYRNCPFCEEEEHFRKGARYTGPRNGRRRETRRRAPSIVGPVVILIVILILALLVWHFLGDKLALRRSPEETPVDTSDTVTPGGVTPGGNGTGDGAAPQSGLEMDKTLQLAVGQSGTINVSGGTEYDWISSDPTVATVNGSGEVTAIGEGTAIITATDVGGDSAVCSVTVTGEGGQSGSQGESQSGGNGQSGGATVNLSGLTLKTEYGTTIKPYETGKFDISMKKGESFRLTVEGTDATFTWSSADSAVATMSESGTLKAVNKGNSIITGRSGDASISIYVRVS